MGQALCEAFCAVPYFDRAAFAAALVDVLNEPARFSTWAQAGERQAERFARRAIVQADHEAATALLRPPGAPA